MNFKRVKRKNCEYVNKCESGSSLAILQHLYFREQMMSAVIQPRSLVTWHLTDSRHNRQWRIDAKYESKQWDNRAVVTWFWGRSRPHDPELYGIKKKQLNLMNPTLDSQTSRLNILLRVRARACGCRRMCFICQNSSTKLEHALLRRLDFTGMFGDFCESCLVFWFLSHFCFLVSAMLESRC